ncbi:MAG: sulfite exporter TauE/SafE family protein [Ilumatobacter sp.]|uniref:sulfite exporter TauE/SafE family protein n=1 Tax=Ilumatobacter sp. TaxID=1967498 RepID=UPI003298630C
MSGTELAIILIAVVLGATVKAVTGMGLPIIAIPIAALFVDLDDAVVTLAFPNVLANAVLAYRERGHRSETRDLPVLAAAGVIGAAIGAIAFVSLPETPLVVVLIVAIVGYVVTFFAKPDMRIGPDRSRRAAPVVGWVAGAFQGAVGISGPIVGSWIHSYRLHRGAHILSVTSLFLITGFTQFAVFAATGELGGRVGASLLACIPVLASIPLGTWLRNRVSTRGFDLAIVAMLVASVGALAVTTFV